MDRLEQILGSRAKWEEMSSFEKSKRDIADNVRLIKEQAAQNKKAPLTPTPTIPMDASKLSGDGLLKKAMNTLYKEATKNMDE
jgi:hypothetical protein